MFKYQRSYQYSVRQFEDNYLTVKPDNFLGVVRVKLDNLHFDDIALVTDLSESNVRRLIRIFEIEGCLRLQPQYHVTAIISSDDFTRALTASNLSADQLRQHHETPPELLFPLSFQLRCLHGLHRIHAAQEFLKNADRWWTVDLYLQGDRSSKTPPVPLISREELLQSSK